MYLLNLKCLEYNGLSVNEKIAKKYLRAGSGPSRHRFLIINKITYIKVSSRACAIRSSQKEGRTVISIRQRLKRFLQWKKFQSSLVELRKNF